VQLAADLIGVADGDLGGERDDGRCHQRRAHARCGHVAPRKGLSLGLDENLHPGQPSPAMLPETSARSARAADPARGRQLHYSVTCWSARRCT
jgi:hypothetical protein